ncbi:MAG: flagellar basal-body protein FlbY [Pseudomonadota bacterium]
MTPMPLAANDPTDRVEQLILLTERLSGLISKETEILQSKRPRELEPYGAEKSKLAALYAQEIRAISNDKSLIAGVAPELTERLATFTKAFEEQAAIQKRALARARRVTEGAIKALADDVARRRQRFDGYGAGGVQSPSPANSPTSIALNQIV